jgi:hypothetical protein
MGYHRPVSAFNPGKLAEHQERLMFKEGRMDASTKKAKELDTGSKMDGSRINHTSGHDYQEWSGISML